MNCDRFAEMAGGFTGKGSPIRSPGLSPNAAWTASVG